MNPVLSEVVAMHTVLLAMSLIALSAGTGLFGRYLNRVPLPLLQVVVGIGLGLSGVPFLQISLKPEVFLLLFVPPLLFADGWRLPKREAFRLRGQILLHAFILVLVNVMLIGLFVHWLRPDIPLWAAFALGSVLSPTDAVAVAAIASRVRIPRTLLHILQGEALLNDASGLVALKFSLLASVGAFSFGAAGLNVLLVSIAGAAIGAGLALLYGRARTLLADADGTTTIPLVVLMVLLPFGAYLLAEKVQVSGILAAVAAGITMSYVDPKHEDNAALRLQAGNFFTLFAYVLNGVIFLLLGLQLPHVLKEGITAAVARGGSAGHLLLLILAVTVVILTIRFAWGWGEAWLVRLPEREGQPDGDQLPRKRVLGAHTVAGIRGAVTLAAAISLPLHLAGGTPFPARAEMILIAAGVIVLTMLLGAFSLPHLLRNLPQDEEKAAELELAAAKVKASHAAIAAISSATTLDQAGSAARSDILQAVTTEYQQRIEAVTPHAASGASTQARDITTQARLVGLRAEREELHRLNDAGEINDETLHELMKPLDLAEESLRS